MSVKLRLPPGLGAATFVVAVVAFGVLTISVSLTALGPAQVHAATQAVARIAS